MTEPYSEDSWTLIEELETAWRNAPPYPSIEQVLKNRQTKNIDPELLATLVLVDLEHRWSRNWEEDAPDDLFQIPTRRPRIESYLALIPSLSLDEDQMIYLLGQEYRIRHEHSAREPKQVEIVRRFAELPAEKILAELKSVDLKRTEKFNGPNLPGFDRVRSLGRGGMGTVYLYRNHSSGEERAIKVPNQQYLSSLRRFKREFRILAQLEHPNLIKLGQLVIDSNAYFTMEYVQGRPLNEYVAGSHDSGSLQGQSFDFDETRLRSSFHQLAKGVAFLHQEKILHRDIKPHNVLVEASGRVVLLDFGLAVAVEEEVFPNTRIEDDGTPAYMPPEQHQGRELSPASDWYSFGVMLYECLTSQLPFRAANPADLLEMKENIAPPSPSSINPKIPLSLSRLCEGLLSPTPDQRPTGRDVIQQFGPPDLTDKTRSRACVGREDSLEAIQKHFESTFPESGRRRPRIVFLSGPSGIGKTSLINEFLRDLRKQNSILVLRGKCSTKERVRYPGFDELVDGVTHVLTRKNVNVATFLPVELDEVLEIFPALDAINIPKSLNRESSSSSSPTERRQRGFEQLQEILSRLAVYYEGRRLVLFLDDMQWGGEDTARLFAHLFSGPNAPDCFTICACRDDEAGRTWMSLVEDRFNAPEGRIVELSHLNLGPLTEADAIELASEMLNDRTDMKSIEPQLVAANIAKESQGYPLLIEILAEDIDQLQLTKQRQTVMEEAYLQRFSRLDPAQQRAVEIVALAEQPLDEEVIVRSAGLARARSHHLANLQTRKLIQYVGHGVVDVHHDKVRETILGSIKASSRVERCEQLLEGLYADPQNADDELLARLHQQIGRVSEIGDPITRSKHLALAQQRFLSAAERAMTILKFHHAAVLLGQALEIAEATGQTDSTLLEAYADACAYAGKSSLAATNYMKAAELDQNGRNLELQCQAALRWLTSGHTERGLEVLKLVMAEVGIRFPSSYMNAGISIVWDQFRLALSGLRPSLESYDRGNSSERLLLVYWTAIAGLSVLDPIRAASFTTRNLREALLSGDGRSVARALAASSALTAANGSRKQKQINLLLAASEQHANSDGSNYAKGCHALATGVSSHLTGRWIEAREACDRACALLSCERDVLWEVNTANAFGIWAIMWLGDLVELGEKQPRLRKHAIDNDDRFAKLSFGSIAMTWVQLGANEPDRARELLDEDRGDLARTGFTVQHHSVDMAYSLLEQYCQRPMRGLEQLIANWPKIKASGLARVQQVRVDHFQSRARAAIAASLVEKGQKHLLLKHAEADMRRLRRENVPWGDALAEVISAGIAAVRGDREQSREHLKLATHRLRMMNMQIFAAATDIVLARLDNENSVSSIQIMEDQGIVDVDQLAFTLVPGFSELMSPRRTP